MSAVAKDISNVLLVVRSRLLTRNAPITSEFANTIMKARMQKTTTKAISTWYDRAGGWGIGGIPVAFELFVAFLDVAKNLLLSICRQVI